MPAPTAKAIQRKKPSSRVMAPFRNQAAVSGSAGAGGSASAARSEGTSAPMSTRFAATRRCASAKTAWAENQTSAKIATSCHQEPVTSVW